MPTARVAMEGMGVVRFDAPALVDLFSYRCQLTADDGQIVVTAVSAPEGWLPRRADTEER